MRRHFLLTMLIGLALTVPAPLGVAFAQSTGPGTHKDGAESVTKEGIGNERSSERTGSSATVDQGLTVEEKERKARSAKKRAKSSPKNKSTEFRDGSGLQSGSTGANSAPATPATP